MKSCFLLRGRPRVARGCPDEGRRPDCLNFYRVKCDGQNRCIFAVSQALLPRILCKYADDLSCGRRRRLPRIAPPVFLSRGLLGCSQGPLENVLQIRGGHQDGHQLESLHFYGVPWPHRRGLKSFNKVIVMLTQFFTQAVFKIQVDRRPTSRFFLGVVVHASTGPIVNSRSP